MLHQLRFLPQIPFGCNKVGGNPVAAAWDYINIYCSDALDLSNFPNVPMPDIQLVASIPPKNACGLTDCDKNKIIQVRICDLLTSNLTIDGMVFPCYDICAVLWHELAHWVYCYTGGTPSSGSLSYRQWYIEIGAQNWAYEQCLKNPLPGDPFCLNTWIVLNYLCGEYNKRSCGAATSLTAPEKSKVKTWCSQPKPTPIPTPTSTPLPCTCNGQPVDTSYCTSETTYASCIKKDVYGCQEVPGTCDPGRKCYKDPTTGNVSCPLI